MSDVEMENPTIPEMVFIKLHNKIFHAERIFKEKHVKYPAQNMNP